MSEVKYTDTKNDIWKAYKEVKAELDAQESAPKTTVDVAQAAKVSSAIKTASTIKVDAVEKSVMDLLAKISGGKSQYNEIVTAIDTKKGELKDILGLEAEANSLVAIVATKDKLVADKTAEAKEIITIAEDKASTVVTEALTRQKDVNEEIRQTKLAITKERNRDEEEYNYSLDRKKKSDTDALQDVLDAKVKVIVDREKAVQLREDDIEELEETVTKLENNIEILNGSIDDKVNEAVAKAKKGAETSANIAKAMDKKGWEATISIKDARITTLEEKVDDLSVQVENAHNAVADAQDKVSNIATSALQAQADAATVTEVSKIAANGKK